MPGEEVQDGLHQLLTSGVVESHPPDLARAVSATGPPGLADRALHHRHGSLGATTLTFDRRQARRAEVERL